MKSLYVHYKNKYPDGQVISKEDSLDVYSSSGEHVVALRKNGAGQMVCVSAEFGLRDAHDLAPIPKDARVHKLVEGKVGLDNLAKDRSEKRNNFLCPDKNDVVLSCSELEAKHGFKFDEKQKEIIK